MSPFELFFGLTTVILGLALTHLANSFQFLLRRGRAVRWAAEPVLQSALILMIVVFVWADQWDNRDQTSFTVVQCILQVLKLLAVYVAAAAVLPEPDEESNPDLHAYYMKTRPVVYGALIAGFLLFALYRVLFLPAEHVPLFNSIFFAAAILTLYLCLILFRWRALHLAGLVLLCLAYAVAIAPRTIG